MKLRLFSIFLVCAGGAFGTFLRFEIENFMTPDFVAAILFCNLVGSFFFALCAECERVAGKSYEIVKCLHSVGFCGGFTTFSTFALQVAMFLKFGKYFEAIALFFITFAGCFAAAFVSRLIVEKIFYFKRKGLRT